MRNLQSDHALFLSHELTVGPSNEHVTQIECGKVNCHIAVESSIRKVSRQDIHYRLLADEFK